VRPRPHRSRTVRAVLKHAVMIAASLAMIYPLLWMVVSSLRPNDEIFRNPSLFPLSFDIDNYVRGWSAQSFEFSHYLMNSTLLVVGCVIGNLFACTLTAYAFARLRFWGRNIAFAVMLMTLMLPIHVVIVPQYILFSQTGWVNTMLPLILPKFLATDAFFVFLMVQFIRGIPRQLDEAAWIDGAGPFRTFWHVILPLMRPALITTTIFTFIWTWNDFFGQLIYLTDSSVFTVPIALNALVDSQSNQGTGTLMAMSLLALLPILLFFAFAQKYLIRGIATTGLK
jgi:multiple sugar transport system permease protein